MKPLLSMILLAALGVACHSPIGLDKQENSYSAVEGGFELIREHHDVQLTEVAVENARSSRPAGLLVVDLELVNTANYRVPLEWRIHWYVEGGAEVQNQNPWRPTVLEVGERRPLTLTAPLPSCKGWRLATRSPHTSN